MLTGDGGTVRLFGAQAGQVTAWTLRPGAGGVSLELTVRLTPYWLRAAQATPPTRDDVRVALTRTANPDYRVTFAGDVAALEPGRLVLHRCKECSR